MKTHMTVFKGYKILYVPSSTRQILVSSLISFSEMHETESMYGASHLLEHILLNSWNKYPDYEINNELLRRGIENNAETHNHYVWYYTYGAESNMNFLLEYLVTIMTAPKFNKHVLNTEIKAIRQELLGYLQNSDTQMEKKMWDTYVPNSPTSSNNDMRKLIKNLKSFDVGKVNSFFKKAYKPSNITFIVLGSKANRNKVVNGIKKLLRPIKAPKVSSEVRITSKFTNLTKSKFIDLPRSDMVKSTVWLVFARDYTSSYRNNIIFNLMGNVLCSNLGSILYEILRIKKKLVYEINSWMEPGPLLESITLNFTCDTSKVYTIILLIKQVIEGDIISDKKWKGIKDIAIRDAKQSCSILDKAQDYSSQWSQFGQLENTVKIINSISKKDVLKCVREVFLFNKVLILHQSPNKFPKNIRDQLLTKLNV